MIFPRFFVASACALGLALSLTRAADAPGETDDESSLSKIQWAYGPTKVALKTLAEVQIPEGFRFTGPQGTQDLLEAMGNPTSGTELGFLAPTSMVWFVVFRFSDVGYVKDDDKSALDASKLLKSIQEGTEEANKIRHRMGSAPLHITGWEVPPRYNEQTHNLEWAVRGESEGDLIVNYNTRLLGRKGVMEVKLVVDPAKLATATPEYQSLITGFSYRSGERYAEYRQGDKLAQYGLAALITGGAAAVAIKTGLLGSLVLFVKKAWKLVVLAVVGIGAWLRRLALGKPPARKDSE
jgi:uncharacterized membrane-anchored protein